MICSDQQLLDYIDEHKGEYSAIIVEGYDGVGKSRVLSLLSDHLGVTPYRPDYNFWQQYNLTQPDRWKMSGYFWDIYSHFFKDIPEKVMLFDRGMLSGAVYSHDTRIAKDYKKITRDASILHILVTCSNVDYLRFQEVRGGKTPEEIREQWTKFLEYTAMYRDLLETYDLTHIVYKNKYKEDLSDSLVETCEGCGHFSYGWCRHPIINCQVNPKQHRCNLSYDKEVQDVDDVSEMHGV